jgi:hypothetical protein
MAEIRRVAEDCREPDWNGEGAEAVTAATAANAIELVRSLPPDLPLPSAAADPDGAISLDWMPSRHRVFSVSIGASNRVAYAWLDGTESGCGVEDFDGVTIPARLRDGIRLISGL